MTMTRPLCAWFVAGMLPALVQAAGPQDIEFFEKKIRPVLVKHCYECHSSDAEDVGGGMLLDSREAMLRGGETGPAVVPKNIEKSLLIEALEYKSLEMPPDGQLPEDVIADFRAWVKMGAPDPRKAKNLHEPKEDAYTPVKADELWSLQPVKRPAVPKVKNKQWPQTEIDHFVLHRMEEHNLQPVGDAPPLQLLRRLCFDLVGLPPTPKQIAEIEANTSPQAFGAIIDELLASPQFGERWGRHWLDVARYAESNGKSRDVLMPHAWRYRDYVIDAMNADVPYDRFIREQIAGDLMPADNAAHRDRLNIATGFLAIGSKTLVGPTTQVDLIDEQIDATGRAVLGLSIGCARCHDHKFDPIPTADYYSLSGIFGSTETLYGGGLKAPKDPVGKAGQLVVLGKNADQRVAQAKKRQKEITDVNKKLGQAKKQLKQTQQKLAAAKKKQQKNKQDKEKEEAAAEQPADEAAENPEKKDKQTEAKEDPVAKLANKRAELAAEIKKLEQQLKAAKERPQPDFEFAIGVRDEAKPQDANILIRGERNRKGDQVERGFLSCLPISDAQVNQQQSGRLELAQWLTHPDNPLTPRVAVNRIWMHLFDRGLVNTVDNFGANGERPSHPELLDYLASRFVENGWSAKQLIREIVSSRAYRLSSDYHQQNAKADPANTWLWRMNRKRLEAEAIRDAMLAASGQLDLERPEASPVARIGDGEVGRGIKTKPLYEPFPHRSVYMGIPRGIVPTMLKVFDFPEPSNVQGKRATTNVPAQSLFLMNNPFVIEQAEHLGRRVYQNRDSDEDRVDLAYRLCFGRPASAKETAQATNYLKQLQGQDAAEKQALESWSTLCHALLASAEFRYLP